MKNCLALCLTLLIIMGFAACGVSDTPESSIAVESQSSEATTSPEPLVSEKQVSTESPQPPEEPSAQVELSIYSLENAVIVDDKDVMFTVTKVEPDALWGFTLNVLCENNTDKSMMYSWDNVSVNGYMLDPFWAEEVAAGKKSNTEISFSSSQLEEYNITTVDEIVFTLRVYDSQDWAADNLIDNEYSVYPTGLDADSVIYPERIISENEQVVIDNENCTFVIQNVEPDAMWGYTLHCYIENKTSDTLTFSWDDVSVNGFMADPFWAKEVAQGKRAYTDISFSSSIFETNGISNVEDIEFKLRVYNSNDWSAPDVHNDVFAYNP